MVRLPALTPSQAPPIKRPAGIDEDGRGDGETDPMEKAAKLALVRAGIEGDGDPHEIHHAEGRDSQAIQESPIGALQRTFRHLRIERHGGVTDLSQPPEGLGELEAAIVPLESQPPAGEVDPRFGYPWQGLEAILDQPDASGAMDAFDQQVDFAGLAQGIDELLLNRIDIVEGQFLGGLWRRA
jgi:hypothetical protein